MTLACARQQTRGAFQRSGWLLFLLLVAVGCSPDQSEPREHDDKASFGPQAVARPRPMAIRQVNTVTRGKGRIKPRLSQVERMGGVDGAAGAIEAAHSMPREEGTHLNDHRVSSRDATTVRLPADVRASFLSLPSPSRRRSRPRPRERRATLRCPSQIPVLPHRRR